MIRPLYDLDLWIRQTLRSTGSVENTRALLADALAQNAVDLGFMELADGSWRWAGEWVWGPGITAVEAVPLAADERAPR